MKGLLIGNLSSTRCGFANFSQQMLTAFAHHGQDITAWDGAYPTIYARQQENVPAFFPADIASYDVVHLIWNAMTLNHYNGADWAALRALPGGGPIISWWDGGPSDASCPFLDWVEVRWSDYQRPGYAYSPYPVPDWVEDLPEPNRHFTVGASSVRGDGVAEIQAVCARHGWAMNLPTPGVWRSIEDEVRRLARSTINVCWYNTPPLWHNRASAPSMLLASRRPILINQDPLVAHLWDYPPAYGVFHGKRWPATEGPDLETCLLRLAEDAAADALPLATRPALDLSWSVGVERFLREWQRAREARAVGSRWQAQVEEGLCSR